MSSPAGIEVRCRCGQRYRADPAHVGKSLRCRCGRIVKIRGPRLPPGRRLLALGNRIRLLPGLWRHSPRALARLTRILIWTYLAVALGLTLLLWYAGDNWWPATAVLFGPRWLFLLPAPVLAIAAILTRPAYLVPLLAALGILVGPGMGYRTGWRTWLAPNRSGDLRIVTFNVYAEQNYRAFSTPKDLQEFEPDVVVLQECAPLLADSNAWPRGWTHRYDATLCIGSRYPILETEELESVETGEFGGTGIARRYRLQSPQGSIDIFTVHLETPRKGLEILRYGGNATRMDPSTLVREVGSSRISRWVRQRSRSAIVAGDFNMPVESVIYRRYWSDCRNAFSTVGRGFGFTRILRNFAVRIDHVLACGGWTPVRAFVGPELGSDHLPLIVDLKRSP